ncbi:MAG: SusC/RagA family TonB-linked outer membrane protein [Carboxylicivirga sp.]|nr:SusC/RagA family TonB-linked outer membrane protein [Carboxylicivirga sp.]
MKNMLILLFVFNLGLHAKGLSQEVKKARYINATLVEVFEDLKEQSGFGILYKLHELEADVRVNLDKENATVQEVLNEVLRNTDMHFKLQDDVIVIYKEKTAFIQKKDDKLIKGKILDENGDPLPGANIIVQETGSGTITDTKGEFVLNVKTLPVTLNVTFIGFETKKIKLENNEYLKLKLISALNDLMEVVVTGYGEIEKRKLSSSVSTIKGEDVIELGTSNVDQMLEGKIAGLVSMENTGTPGAAPKIRIRGNSSITGNREPLWVVDGIILDDPVEISAAELNSADHVNLIGNAISSLNPEDIERIDVLKDASATAIYGTKAANGVIVVTTKKGKGGGMNVRYTNRFSIKTRPNYDQLNLMNSADRIAVSHEIYERGLEYLTLPAPTSYEGALYDWQNHNITFEQFQAQVTKFQKQNTDWFDLLFENSLSQKHNVSFSGSSGKVNYYTSLSYQDDQGTVIGEEYKKYNAFTKLNFRFNEKLNLQLTMRVADSNRDYLHSSIDAYKYAYNTSRALAPYDENGDLLFYNRSRGNKSTYLQYNVLNEIAHSGREIENRSWNLSSFLKYQIYDWLSFENTMGYNVSNTTEEAYVDNQTYYISKLRKCNLADFDVFDQELAKESVMPFGGILKRNTTSNSSYTFRNAIRLKKRFKKNELNVNLGNEIRSNSYNGYNFTRGGYYPNRGLTFAQIDQTRYPKYTSWVKYHPDNAIDNVQNYLSYYATFIYAYDNRYSVNFNYRTDGSNAFGQAESNKFLPVYSTSFRWNGHNESFLENVNWLSQLSLRGSYGIQGNVHPSMTPNLIVKQQPIDPVSTEFGSSIVRLPNPKLRWEKTKTYNIGLDLGLFKNKFTLTAEYYHKKGEDQIISKRVSKISGVNSIAINAGDIVNKGYELAINATLLQKKDFLLSTNIIGFKNTNEVLTSNNEDTYTYHDYVSGNAYLPGNPVDGFYSYRFGGLDKRGLPTFEGIDPEDGATKEERFEKMFVYSGQRTPDVSGSFSLFAKYKRFRINCLFAYSLGAKVRLNNLYSNSGQRLAQPYQNMTADFVNRWRREGDEQHTIIPTLSSEPMSINFSGYDEFIGDSFWQMYNQADMRVVSADYLKLNNVSISYDLGRGVCEKLKVKHITLKAEGRSLHTWASKELNGQDPDHASFGFNTVPTTPTYSFGVDIKF